MKTQKIFNLKAILFIFLSLALAVSALGLISVNKAKASTTHTISQSLVLPKSNLEYQKLDNPVDTYSDDHITAILQDGKVIVYKNGVYQTIAHTDLEQAKQIKKLNDNTLLLSSGTITRQVNLNTSEISYFTINNSVIGNTSFDFNDKYFVTTAGTTVKIYALDGSSIADDKILNVITDSPIAINNNDEIFFIKDAQLKKHKIGSKDETSLTDVIPSNKIIANNEYVYYFVGADVYRISVNGDEAQKLASPTSRFDLGETSEQKNSPKSISFKGDNILITSKDAVQEFSVTEDGNLEFTGFAIAKGKTAFNRVNSTLKDNESENRLEIEREKNTLAILDNNALSIINVAGEFNPYDKQNFTHFDNNALNYVTADTNESVSPNTFALGDGSALLLYNQGNGYSRLSLLDLNTGNKTQDFSISAVNAIRDICYQSGKYYALLDIANNSARVYESQNGTDFTEIPLISNFYADVIDVDVFGNVYLYGNGKVYKYDKQDDFNRTNLKDLANVKKLETDLAGNLFASTDNGTYVLKDNEWEEYQFSNSIGSVQSFALDYDKKEVYCVYKNEELVYKTQELPNLSVDDIEIPDTFITTSSNAIDQFKTYTAKDGANVYSVSLGAEKFTFNELVKDANDYAFVTDINVNGITLYALVGQERMVLINQNDVLETTPDIDTEVPESAFITTSVSGYYLPIITADGEYALTSEQVLRLTKEQIIKPKYKITFLGKQFYFADFIIDGNTYTGYVPTNYTISVLSQDFEWNKYSIETVSATNVYSDEQLVNEITELKSDTKIRLISKKDGVCYVAFLTEAGWVNGYISSSSIQDSSNIAVRNLLIIIAVMASVCGTTTFFILRKKSNGLN